MPRLWVHLKLLLLTLTQPNIDKYSVSRVNNKSRENTCCALCWFFSPFQLLLPSMEQWTSFRKKQNKTDRLRLFLPALFAHSHCLDATGWSRQMVLSLPPVTRPDCPSSKAKQDENSSKAAGGWDVSAGSCNCWVPFSLFSINLCLLPQLTGFLTGFLGRKAEGKRVSQRAI